MNRNINIQVLRIICALIVYAGHSLGMMHNQVFDGFKDTPLHLLFDGQSAVFVFFAISGFFYYRSNERQAEEKFGPYYLTHLKKKILKITPPHILLLVVAFVFCNYLNVGYNHALFTEWANSFWQEKCSIVELVRQALIILPRDPNILNPPSWYLTIEVRMFIIMPVIIWLLNKTSWKFVIAMLIVPLFIQLPIIDTILFYLLPTLAHRHIEKIKMLLNGIWSKVLVLVIGLVLINIRNEVMLGEEALITYDSVLSYIQAIGATLIVVMVYLIPQTLDLSSKLNKILLTLSDFTYEFYLTHFVVLLVLRSLVTNTIQMVITSFVLSAIITVMVKNICGVFDKMVLVQRQS